MTGTLITVGKRGDGDIEVSATTGGILVKDGRLGRYYLGIIGGSHLGR